MTLHTPIDLQNGSYAASEDRLIWQLLFSNTGVVQAGDLLVTQSVTPAMTVLVAAGSYAFLPSVFTLVSTGTYLGINDAAITGVISAAHPTLPRIDLVGITINDASVSGSLNSAVLTVIAGVPNASPTAPVAPSNFLTLASVAVAAAATSIVNANITDLRTRSAHNELVVGTANSAAAPLTIQLASAQTGNALTIKNSAGTIIGYIDANGNPHGSLASIFTPVTLSTSQSVIAFTDNFLTAAGTTQTLPASPNVNDEIHFFDLTGTVSSSPVVVNSNGLKINGTVQNLNIDKNYGRAYLKYTGATYGWEVF